jgi:hypothetical protein
MKGKCFVLFGEDYIKFQDDSGILDPETVLRELANGNKRICLNQTTTKIEFTVSDNKYKYMIDKEYFVE